MQQSDEGDQGDQGFPLKHYFPDGFSSLPGWKSPGSLSQDLDMLVNSFSWIMQNCFFKGLPNIYGSTGPVKFAWRDQQNGRARMYERKSLDPWI